MTIHGRTRPAARQRQIDLEQVRALLPTPARPLAPYQSIETFLVAAWAIIRPTFAGYVTLDVAETADEARAIARRHPGAVAVFRSLGSPASWRLLMDDGRTTQTRLFPTGRGQRHARDDPAATAGRTGPRRRGALRDDRRRRHRPADDEPAVGAQAKAQWLIPSTYREHDARDHEVQRERGQFSGSPPTSTTATRRWPTSRRRWQAVVRGCQSAIYSTRSATADDRRMAGPGAARRAASRRGLRRHGEGLLRPARRARHRDGPRARPAGQLVFCRTAATTTSTPSSRARGWRWRPITRSSRGARRRGQPTPRPRKRRRPRRMARAERRRGERGRHAASVIAEFNRGTRRRPAGALRLRARRRRRLAVALPDQRQLRDAGLRRPLGQPVGQRRGGRARRHRPAAAASATPSTSS